MRSTGKASIPESLCNYLDASKPQLDHWLAADLNFLCFLICEMAPRSVLLQCRENDTQCVKVR